MGGYQGSIERAAPALAATYAISRAVSIPVMTSSGVSEVTAAMALAAGAKGVGVGSAVNKLNVQIAMVAVVRAVANAMNIEKRVADSEDVATVAAPATVTA
eukprot:7205-Heterococcus_DN1.PRE.2